MNKTTFTIIALALLTTMRAEENTMWGIEMEDGIPKLSSSNFDTFIKENPLVFVKFYAPWCGHCKKMIPDYQKLVQKMGEEGVPIVKLDATIDKDVASKYGVKGFPSLKLFKNGQPVDYKGGRTENDIFNWINKKKGDSTKLLNTDEEITEFSKQNVAVLLVTTEGEEETLNAFKALADDDDDLPHAYTYNTEYARTLGLSGKMSLVVFRNFDDGNKSLSQDTAMSKKQMSDFVGNVKFPLVMDFDEKSAQKIFGEKKPGLFLFTDDLNIEQVALFKQLAKEKKDSIYFSISPISKGLGAKLANMVDVKATDAPVLRIVTVGKDGMMKFKVDDMSLEGMKKAIDDFKAGKLQQYFKSAAAPATNDEPVKVVVGDTFKEMVVDSDAYVLVEVYAPWCGHCKKLDPIYTELATKLAKHDDVLIVKMDGTQNEYPGFNVRGYPTLGLYKPGSDKPVMYQKERSLEMMMTFLEEHMGRSLGEEVETDL